MPSTASLDIDGVPCDSVSPMDKPKDIIYVEPAMLPAEKTKLDLVERFFFGTTLNLNSSPSAGSKVTNGSVFYIAHAR